MCSGLVGKACAQASNGRHENSSRKAMRWRFTGTPSLAKRLKQSIDLHNAGSYPRNEARGDRMRSNVPYSGYYHRPQRDEDTLLTKVGPGTPCGEYLRRYWHPFMLSSELNDLPVVVSLLGEDLVI